MQREELAVGFAIHETATIATVWPALPCFNNLVVFDQLKRVESADSVVGELAEKWSWQDGYRNLVFFLRKDVKWHDGKPFTSKDVKFTFDMVREAPEAQAKLRTNPRKDWYANVEADRGRGPVHRRLQAQAAPALDAPDARVRPVAGLPGARATGRAPQPLRRHRALQAQGVAQGRVRRVREESRLLRQGPALPRRAQVPDHLRARHAHRRHPERAARRLLARARRRARSPSSSRPPYRAW